MSGMTISELQQEVHQTAKEHGWWEEPPSFPEIIALIHSEASEALEEYRMAIFHLKRIIAKMASLRASHQSLPMW